MQVVQRYLMWFFTAALMTAGACSAAPAPTQRQIAERVRQFSADAMVLNDATLARLEALEAKLGAVPLDRVLIPAQLFAPGGGGAARAAVAQMRALLAERRDVLRVHQEKTARVITPDLNAIMGPHNLARLAASKADAERRQDNLDTARMQVADAIDGVLAWMAGEGRGVTVEKGQMMLDTAQQGQQYKALLARIERAAENEATAMAALEEKRPELQKKLDEQRARLAKPK